VEAGGNPCYLNLSRGAPCTARAVDKVCGHRKREVGKYRKGGKRKQQEEDVKGKKEGVESRQGLPRNKVCAHEDDIEKEKAVFPNKKKYTGFNPAGKRTLEGGPKEGLEKLWRGGKR